MDNDDLYEDKCLFYNIIARCIATWCFFFLLVGLVGDLAQVVNAVMVSINGVVACGRTLMPLLLTQSSVLARIGRSHILLPWNWSFLALRLLERSLGHLRVPASNHYPCPTYLCDRFWQWYNLVLRVWDQFVGQVSPASSLWGLSLFGFPSLVWLGLWCTTICFPCCALTGMPNITRWIIFSGSPHNCPEFSEGAIYYSWGGGGVLKFMT